MACLFAMHYLPYNARTYLQDEDSEDLEDLVINANDAVIVCARNEDDVSHLEARNAYSLLTLSFSLFVSLTYACLHMCLLSLTHL